MNVLIDADGRPGVSDVMKNKTSSRTLPLIRLNLRLWRRWWAFSRRADCLRPAGRRPVLIRTYAQECHEGAMTITY